MTELHELSLEDLAARVADARISRVDAAEHALSRIEEHDPRLNAFVEVRSDEAREVRSPSGPLAGVPVAVKDMFVDRDRTPTCGSRVRAHWMTGSATAIDRLRSAGATIIGYTNLHEWGLASTSAVTATGPVRNPWDRARVAGGSSGGSAAALAAGLVSGAIGTDAGGSIRCPAACCGVVGLKPTWGLVPTDGFVDDGCRFDHVGPMARTVGDVRLLLSALANREFAVERAGGLEVATARNFFFDDIATDVAEALGPAFAALERIAGRPREVVVAGATDALTGAGELLARTADMLANDLASRPEDFQPATRALLSLGAAATREDRARADEIRLRLRRSWDAVFAEVDVVVTPTLPAIPARIESESVQLPSGIKDATIAYVALSAPMNLGGIPALSLPCGMTASGFPVSLTLSAARGRDDAVLALGSELERELDGMFANRLAPAS